MTQGDRIKKIRKDLRLTLEEFGEKVGVTKQTISRIENGINNLTDQMAKSICREFNVNPDYLIYGNGDPFSNLPQTVLDDLCKQYNCDSLDRNLIECYLKLNASERQTIKKYIKDIYKAEAAATTSSIEAPQQTTEELEEEYKKSVLKTAQKTGGFTASNTTDGGEDKKAVG